MTATISSILYQPLDLAYADGRFDTFLREPLTTAVLLENHGIQGDRKAGKNPRRQLNIVSNAWSAQRSAEGFNAAPGEFGEQLRVDGLDVEALPAGSQLQIGAQAVIEITGPRTGCERLQAAQPIAIDPIQPRVGMLARVLIGGPINLGDAVALVTAARQASFKDASRA